MGCVQIWHSYLCKLVIWLEEINASSLMTVLMDRGVGHNKENPSRISSVLFYHATIIFRGEQEKWSADFLIRRTLS